VAVSIGWFCLVEMLITRSLNAIARSTKSS